MTLKISHLFDDLKKSDFCGKDYLVISRIRSLRLCLACASLYGLPFRGGYILCTKQPSLIAGILGNAMEYIIFASTCKGIYIMERSAACDDSPRSHAYCGSSPLCQFDTICHICTRKLLQKHSKSGP